MVKNECKTPHKRIILWICMPKCKENVEDVWKMVNMQAIWSTKQQQVLCISMKLLYMIKYNAINAFFFISLLFF